MRRKPVFMGGSIGNCAHIAGVYSYLQYANENGMDTIFLGPSVSPEAFASEVNEAKPDVVCIGYRLNPQSLEMILDTFMESLDEGLRKECRFYFGGIPSCVEVARKTGLFSRYFVGEEGMGVIRDSLILDSAASPASPEPSGLPDLRESLAASPSLDKLVEAMEKFPLLRHHFGLPSLDETLDGVARIAESGVLDIISIAPDQNAQERFFSPEDMCSELEGSGGVPLRTEEDLLRIKEAASRGNHPMLKIYAGTNDLVRWAEMSHRTLSVPWGTVPIFWYSTLDGRSSRPLEEAISENLDALKWYASEGVPVEVNDSHQWSLRESSDAVAVASFYISAYVAKSLGVRTYVGQFMFNTPRLTTGRMDIAKMMAKMKITEELQDEGFVMLRQARAGLTHFSVDPDMSKGQLASSVALCRSIRPHVIHVVAYCEADHAASAEDVIESCKIVRGALRTLNNDFPAFVVDEEMQRRTDSLVKDARGLISAFVERFKAISPDPLVDPHCLARLVSEGFMDAPQLLPAPDSLQGTVKTGPSLGGYDSMTSDGAAISECERISKLLSPDSGTTPPHRS